MSKRLVSIALLLVALSSPMQAAPRRDDGDRNERSFLGRIVHSVVHTLEDIILTWPKP